MGGNNSTTDVVHEVTNSVYNEQNSTNQNNQITKIEQNQSFTFQVGDSPNANVSCGNFSLDQETNSNVTIVSKFSTDTAQQISDALQNKLKEAVANNQENNFLGFLSGHNTDETKVKDEIKNTLTNKTSTSIINNCYTTKSDNQSVTFIVNGHFSGEACNFKQGSSVSLSQNILFSTVVDQLSQSKILNDLLTDIKKSQKNTGPISDFFNGMGSIFHGIFGMIMAAIIIICLIGVVALGGFVILKMMGKKKKNTTSPPSPVSSS